MLIYVEVTPAGSSDAVSKEIDRDTGALGRWIHGQEISVIDYQIDSSVFARVDINGQLFLLGEESDVQTAVNDIRC